MAAPAEEPPKQQVEAQVEEEVPYEWDLDAEHNLVEKYPDVKNSSLQLAHKWVLWEQFEPVVKEAGKGKGHDFYDNMRKVGYFHDVVGYCQLKNHVPHFNLLNFFYDYIMGRQHS
jgi:hypothetical protein